MCIDTLKMCSVFSDNWFASALPTQCLVLQSWQAGVMKQCAAVHSNFSLATINCTNIHTKHKEMKQLLSKWNSSVNVIEKVKRMFKHKDPLLHGTSFFSYCDQLKMYTITR